MAMHQPHHTDIVLSYGQIYTIGLKRNDVLVKYRDPKFPNPFFTTTRFAEQKITQACSLGLGRITAHWYVQDESLGTHSCRWGK